MAHHFLVVGVAVVGKGVDRNAAAGSEDAAHLDVARIHELHQVLHYYIDAVLVEIAVVAEAEQIEFQAFALDHVLAGNVVDDDGGKVGLAGFWAQGGEFGAVEGDEIFVFGVFVLESFKDFGAVACWIFDALISEECA